MKIGRFHVSKFYDQAIFRGAALEEAEKRIKTPRSPYLLPTAYKGYRRSDFSGYTCRWEDIPSHKGETISVIIKVLDKKKEGESLASILGAIEKICSAEGDYHPISPANMKQEDVKDRINMEAKIISGNKKGPAHLPTSFQFL